MLLLAAMATVAGTGGAFSAWALLKLIAFATNLLWYARLSFAPTLIEHRSALLLVLIPVLGGLIVGLMARFERTRSAATASPRRSRPSSSATASCR
jgi:uncharacterized YccA/Bax inhibitor family protein